MPSYQELLYRDNVDLGFAEIAYQYVASRRYGIKFCCNSDLSNFILDKEKSDYFRMLDLDLTRTLSDPSTQIIEGEFRIGGFDPSNFTELTIISQ